MYIAVATPLSRIPASISATRSQTDSGTSSRASVASAASPTTTAFETVPRPGFSRSGIHSSSTSRLNRMTACPRVIGTCRMNPEWSTSHGASPSSPRTISARLAP